MSLALIDRLTIFPIIIFMIWIIMIFGADRVKSYRKELFIVAITAIIASSFLSFLVFVYFDMDNSIGILFDVLLSLFLLINNPITVFAFGAFMIYSAVKSVKTKKKFIITAIISIVYGVLLTFVFLIIHIINQRTISILNLPIILLIMAIAMIFFAFKFKMLKMKFVFLLLSMILIVTTIYAENIRISPIGTYLCHAGRSTHQLRFGSYTFNPYSSNLFNAHQEVIHSCGMNPTNDVFIYTIHRTGNRNIIRLEFEPNDSHPDGLVGWYYINRDIVRFPSLREYNNFGNFVTYSPPRFMGRRLDRRALFRW